MTGAIRTQVRLNATGIKTPQGLEFSRACPHCELDKEETAEHILWECSLSADIRAVTKEYLSRVVLDSPARAGIPTDWEEWPALLRAFDIIGLELEIIESMKALPSAPARAPRILIPLDYLQLLSWRNKKTPSRRTEKGSRFKGNIPAKAAQIISQFLGDFLWKDNFVHPYTDGSCHNQQYPWLTRSGAGVFWGLDHPLNIHIAQGGQSHTSPRAELLAIVTPLKW